MTHAASGGIPGYGQEIAAEYDTKSRMDKGDRETQKKLVLDLARHLRPEPARFIDLGCGTGFFTEALARAFPSAQVVFVDGSSEMLAIAREKLESFRDSISIQSRLQSIDWKSLPQDLDFAFSSLCIHHLEHEEKWELFRSIHKGLRKDGFFILVDQFAPTAPEDLAILEYLACKDIQRRIMEETGLEEVLEEIQVGNLIATDRRLRFEEGDRDATLESQIHYLKQAGFRQVVPFYQETRYFALVAIK